VPDAAPGAAPGEGTARIGAVGPVAIAAATVLVLVTAQPALPVAAVAVAAAVRHVARGRATAARLLHSLGAPVLLGLCGVAVALGALARRWTWPGEHVAHLDPWRTALVGAVAAVGCNNLPASALLSARPVDHPVALLVGLGVGPNLCVTGSLAWLVWWRSATSAGFRPSLVRVWRVGVPAAVIGLVAAVAAGVAVGSI
jgi:arsenical pump membrane protein